MSLHHIANHLASKGRNGDETLVHMTKGEVAGLQALAQRHGTSLTRNPDTGLPEAFGLKQLLPMAAGAALTPFVGPMGAAAIVGGLGYMQSGSLTKGLMAGMGAYGGAGLAGGLSSMGTEAGTQLAAGEAEAAGAKALADEQAKQAILQETASGVGAPPPLAPTVSPEASLQSTLDYHTNAAGNTFELNGGYRPTFGPEAMGPQLPGATTDVMIPSNTGFTASTQQTLAQNPMQSGLEAAYKNPGAYVDKLGGGMQAAKYGAAAAAPAIADALMPEQKKYTPPEIKSDSDPGQQYMFESGYDNSLPGRTGQPSYTKISSEEAKKYYGYAEGGEVQYPVGEPVMRMAEGGQAAAAPVAQSYFTGYSPVDAYVAARGLGLGVNYSGYDTPVNQGIAAVVPQAVSGANPNQRIIDLYKADEAKRAAEAAAAAKAEAAVVSGSNYTIGKPGKFGIVGANNGTSGSDVVGIRADGTPVYGEFTPDANGLYGPGSRQYDTYMAQQRASAANQHAGASGGSVSPEGFGMAAGGGISTLGGYSDGGRLLKGPGNGTSDSIPAQIGDKQPARLADGEFVIPSRIVSEIGNGSTDAGARELYKMMDRVQQARGKTVGKNKVAFDAKARTKLPA